MQSFANDSSFVKYRDEDESLSSSVARPLLAKLKDALFSVFLRMNARPTELAQHYHLAMLAIETLQCLSLLLGSQTYSSFGPNGQDSLWNVSQIGWLIDLCWVVRVDYYFHSSQLGFYLFIGIIASLLAFTLAFLVILALYHRPSNPTALMVKGLKIAATLLGNLLFIPMVDTLVFGLRCSVSEGRGCLEISPSYWLIVLFCGLLAVQLSLSGLMSALYYDFCMYCGSIKAKPHPRFKLLRLVLYTAVIFTCYFAPQDSSASVIISLLVSLACGSLLSFVMLQYIPYYNPRILRIRMGAAVAFTCAAFCLLIGECFRSADSTNSSVTMLFYFLTPCLVQITHLGTIKRWKSLAEKPVAKMSSYLEVELKARLIAERLQRLKPSYSQAKVRSGEEMQAAEEYQRQQDLHLLELETLFTEAAKKYPRVEWLYLWSGLLQEHLFGRYVLTMVQCFKGLQLANKLDSQYAFYHFRYSSQDLYKAHIKDDAYEYVLFEKCFQSAQKNDEKVTMSQYRFWSELESSIPRIQKLNLLAGETSYMIGVAKSTYQHLIKLNAKSTQTLRMFGGFLTSLNNFSDMGQRYVQKAELEDEAHAKTANATVLNSLTQPLSFFDASNAVLTVSADFETIGEILKVNEASTHIFGYLKAEMEGRSLNLLIPLPFVEQHDGFMERFHMTGGKNVIDSQGLCLVYLHKMGYLVQGRMLVKVVPNETMTPYLMTVIKETKPDYEFLLLNDSFLITGHSKNCDHYLPLSDAQAVLTPIQTLILNWEEVKTTHEDQLLKVEAATADPQMKPKCKLLRLALGDGKAWLLQVETGELPAKIEPKIPGESEEAKGGDRQISVLKETTPSETIMEKPIEPESGNDTSMSEEESEEDSSEGSDVESGSMLDSKEDSAQPGEEKSADSQVTPASSDNAAETSPHIVIQTPSNSSKDVSKSSRSESEAEEYGQEVNDAHSAYSSSKSMNSSMASLAQFNKSIKALMSYEFQRTKQQVLRFKVTLLATVALLIVTSAVTFQVIGTSVSYNERLSGLVERVGNMRLLSQSLSYHIRMLSLIDAGFVASSNRTAYLQWLGEDAALMHELNVELHDTADLLRDADRQEYIRGQVSTWYLSNGAIVETHTTLFDATAVLVLHAGLLVSEGQPISLQDERAFYVYRNGEGELLSAINRSAGFYVDSAGDSLVSARLTAILLILASVIVLLLCAGLAVIPTLKTLDSSKMEVWGIFLEMPAHICRIMKGKCNERLQLLNEAANLELEGGEEDGEDEKSKKEKDSETSEKARDKHSKQKQRKALSKDIHMRKVLSAKLSCFFIMSIVYFYLIYYTGFQAVGSVLAEEPVTINWASRLRQISRSVNFWMNEGLVENFTGLGYKYVVPYGQNAGFPVLKALTAVQELEYVENSLIFGNPDAGLSFSDIRSSDHDYLLFSNGCVVEPNRSLADCSIVGDKAMMQGLHSALDMYATLARTVLQQVEGLGPEEAARLARSSQVELLRAMDERYLYDSLNYSVSLYKLDYNSSQNQMKIWQNVLICVFSICSVALFALVYSPMIQNLGQETKQAWSMCSLIPQEYQEEFKYLNKVIRERRDNFVWR